MQYLVQHGTPNITIKLGKLASSSYPAFASLQCLGVDHVDGGLAGGALAAPLEPLVDALHVKVVPARQRSQLVACAVTQIPRG